MDSDATWSALKTQVTRLIGSESTERDFKQLESILGEDEAHKIVAQCHAEALGSAALASVQDLLTFSLALCKHGGFVEVVGRHLSIAAISRGAKVDEPNEPDS